MKTKTTLIVLDSSGDTRIEFDETEATAAAKAEAQALFDKLTEKGSRAFRVNAGEQDGQINSFSEVQGEVVMVPRIVGG